jgi:hypothetical protein
MFVWARHDCFVLRSRDQASSQFLQTFFLITLLTYKIGRRSYLKPWTEPNFGVTFRYRREADDTQGSTEDPRYSIFPHDGSLFGALMRSKTSTLSTRPAACKVDSCPGLSVSSTLPRSPISTPPSNATSKQTSQIPSPIDYSRRLSLITPPTSLSTGNSCEIHDNILDKPNTRQQQVPSKRLKVSPRSNSLLSLLFTEEEYMLNRHNSADHQSNPKKNSKEREWRRAAGGITGLDGKEETGDDSDSCMGSIEVRAMRMQQHQRLERKEFESPVVECQRNGKALLDRALPWLIIKAIDRTSNKIPQGRPVIKVGGATRATRVTFREREPTRRGAPVRGVETKVA